MVATKRKKLTGEQLTLLPALKPVAEFSPCRRYRYTLWRTWGDQSRYAMFICLNPSTADEVQDDPTVRRCIRYSQSWGYGAFCMTNLFGFRATDPRVMFAEVDPVGADNDQHLLDVAAQASVIVAAWGNHGIHQNRAQQVTEMLGAAGFKLHYLQLTQAKQPGHPLYLKKDLQPTRWTSISFH
jgi:hypothetical protein